MENETVEAPSTQKYEGKRVLITGGTGSFGKTMAKYLLDRDVGEVRVLSRDEDKQHHMRIDFADQRLQFHVGDVRDERSVRRAVDGIDLVFHAAALKQVPSCEFFPMQAVMTNIIGSANVIEASQQAGVDSVVLLSTDKAVRPANAMGMTKAIMEKVGEAAARASDSKTVVSTVRYGNVLYSRGSVVPLFIDQIKRGEVLTVTDPDMTRFLMPLWQCVDLVEFAFFNAQPGDTFIRKAYSSTIGDLAGAVNDLFGNPSAVKRIGPRHGEKLYEVLASAEELRRSQDMGEYFRLSMDARDLNYAEYFEVGDPEKRFDEDYTSHNIERLDMYAMQDLLLTLPEMQAELAAWNKQ